MTSRRELLERLQLGLTVLPAFAFAPQSLFGSLLTDPEGTLVPAKAVPANPFTRGSTALVAMVHGHDVARMLDAGLELLGGLDRLALNGKRVLLKPNVVNNRPPPSTTNPEVVSAVARRVRQAGAADIIVADSSGMLRFPTRDNLIATGVRQAGESAGARLLALEDEAWVRVQPPRAKALPAHYISKPVYEADLFINMPVIKTHRFAQYSCTLKNLVGITHPRYRPSLSFLSGDWHERIAELNLAVHPHLNIADGTTIMIAGGPTTGTPAKANVLVLSGDRVALDVVAIAIIRSYGQWPKLDMPVWEQRQIKRAVELGLGTEGPDRMELLTRALAPDEGFEKLVETVRRDVFGRG